MGNDARSTADAGRLGVALRADKARWPIQQNNIYRLLSSALAGMQEYMALDKLHDLYTGGYFDLVV
ncbi:MAG: hypothetical protein R3E66_24005 [bacterium]